jgi:SAM-dependent methyltransferase
MPSRLTVVEPHGPHLRLATYFLGDGGSWDDEWDVYNASQTRMVMEYYRRYPVVYPALLRYLPRGGETLEAGSGLGFWVALLAEAGYRARGVDRSPVAVRHARAVFPGLSFEEGDVLDLPYENDSLSGYVSFGLAEHFREGPLGLLQEAARVLRPGGVAIVTVPWASPFRRLRPGRPLQPPSGAVFYQYHFSREELRQNLIAAGFDPVAFATYSPLKTLRDELLSFSVDAVAEKEKPNPRETREESQSLTLRRRALWRTHHLLLENLPMRAFAGHMILAAARKREVTASKR